MVRSFARNLAMSIPGAGWLLLLLTSAGWADCLGSQIPCFQVISNAGTPLANQKGLSGDGKVAVGLKGQLPERAWRWSGGTTTFLPAIGGTFSIDNYGAYSYAPNSDGAIIGGESQSEPSFSNYPTVWTNGAPTKMAILHSVVAGTNGYGAVYGVNGAGTVFVGWVWNAAGKTQAASWSGGNITALPYFSVSDTQTYARGVSDDGSIIAGDNFANRAVRWVNGAVEDLGKPSGAGSSITTYAISGDGKVIVGTLFYDPAAHWRGWRWANGTMTELGSRVANGNSYARGVNADGSVIAGYTEDASGNNQQAGRWTQAKGWESIQTLLTNAGIDMTGWKLYFAQAVSRDGRTFFGGGQDPNGQSQTWLARLPAPGSTPHDFNADSKSDILWRANTGDIAMWFMNGTTLSSGAGVGAIDPNWSIIKTPTGKGDFNGDGKADILWHHTNGSIAMWLMNGATVASGSGLGSVDPSWQIVGVGDFDGDGKADMLWRSSSGSYAIWFMNGFTVASSAGVATVAPTWQVAAIADLNGDGKADIVLRNTSTGDVAVWLMNGATIASGAGLGVLPSAWQIVGTGDFDGDGKADLLWRHSGGSLAMWFMNGTTVASSASVGAIDPAWNVASTGDYDGNGKADILWRSTGGDVAVWLMNGATIASGASLGVLPAAWQIVE